ADRPVVPSLGLGNPPSASLHPRARKRLEGLIVRGRGHHTAHASADHLVKELNIIPAVERDAGLLIEEIVTEAHSLTTLRYRRSTFDPSFIAGGSRTGSTSVGTRWGSGLDPVALYCWPALAATWLAMWGAPNSPKVLARAWGTARVGTTFSGPQRAVASRART